MNLRSTWKQHAPKVYLGGELLTWSSVVAAAIERRWSWMFADMAISGLWSNWRREAKYRREGTDRAALLEDRLRFARSLNYVVDKRTRSAALEIIDRRSEVPR